MIDKFALLLGHGLMALAFLRLLLRDGLDADPLISTIEAETATNRAARSAAGRSAARRARAAGDEAEAEAGMGAQAAPRAP